MKKEEYSKSQGNDCKSRELSFLLGVAHGSIVYMLDGPAAELKPKLAELSRFLSKKLEALLYNEEKK